jgi:hypothetical protein
MLQEKPVSCLLLGSVTSLVVSCQPAGKRLPGMGTLSETGGGSLRPEDVYFSMFAEEGERRRL